MSTQELTLEQACKDPADELSPFEYSLVQQTISAAGAQSNLHEVFRHLVNTLTLPQPLGDMLHALATLTMQALEADLCVIMLRDQASNVLRMNTCAPDLSDRGVVIQPISIDPNLWEQLRAAILREQLPALPEHKIAALNPLKNVQYTTLFPVPLFVGTECIGLLNCYSSKVQRYSDEDWLMLNTIANQAALAIKHRRCVEEDMQAHKNQLRAFVDDLFSGRAELEGSLRQRAYFLGYDLAKPHAITLLELSNMEIAPAVEQPLLLPQEERLMRYEAAIAQVKACIQSVYPYSLIDERDNILVCLFCLDTDSVVDHLNAWLRQLILQIQEERHIRMFAGIGNLCHIVSDYRRGYAEASEALALGQHMHDQRCSALFNELGVYRYIHAFACTDTLRDQYQDTIDVIIEYDRRKKTNLLDTLETYLECGGNIARTSSLLDVHRNTLLQRIERLQKLSFLNLEQLQHRLPLLVALKVYHLRAHTLHNAGNAGIV